MASYWDSNPISADALARCGPLVDGVLGTDGKYQSINDAITAGWTRMLVTTGAIITADVTLAGTRCCLVGLGSVPITGNYKLTVSSDDAVVSDIRLSNNAGIGLCITGNRAKLAGISVSNCNSHGIQLNGSAGSHRLVDCVAYNNGGDGLRIEAANDTFITVLRSQQNTGYGVNDLSNIMKISVSDLRANTAGAKSGTSTYIDTSVRLA